MRSAVDFMTCRTVAIKDQMLRDERNKKPKSRLLKRELDHLEYGIELLTRLAGFDMKPAAFTRHVTGSTWEDKPLDIGMGIIFKITPHKTLVVKLTDDNRVEVRSSEGRVVVHSSSSNVIVVDTDVR